MNIPVISLEGSPYNIGLKHGSQAKEAITKNVQFYINHWGYFCGVTKAQILEDASKFIPVIAQFDPQIIEELNGIAKGAGLQIEEIIMINARWELNYAYNKWATPKQLPPEGCTAFAVTSEVTSDQHTLVGQNWDYNPHDSLLIVHIKQEDKPTIVMSIEAGAVGQKGLNSAGIGIVQNYLQCENDSFRIGLPTLVKERGILNCTSFSDCLKVLTNFEGPNSANLLLAHLDGEAINVECAPTDEFFIYPDNGILVHSNHFISNLLKVKDTGKTRVPDSIMRYHRASRLFQAQRGSLEKDTIEEILSDHFGYPQSICRHRIEDLNANEQSETNTSVIIDLTEGEMFYTEGPPCSNIYKKISINDF